MDEYLYNNIKTIKQMTNGITYYKLKSPYVGDTTKNCALTGPEVDNNFFTLENRDIKSITVEGNDIVLNLVNGDDLRARDAFDNFIVNVDFNSKDGVLKIYRNNGDIEELKGFTTSWNVQNGGLNSVAVDSTLKGNGLTSSPISISSSYQTGQYKPVNEFISKRYDCFSTNPKYDKPEVGDRFIVEEQVSDYGLLYDYRTVMQLACDLQRANSKWRVPTKEDWDDMLNAVEPNACDKNHNIATPNKFLGEWAGKLLKSTNKWFEPHDHPHHHPIHFENEMHHHSHPFNEDEMTPFVNECNTHHNNECHPSHCGEHEPFYDCDDKFTKGIDKFGFKVMPAGYADDGGNSVFFGERGGFWTATNMKLANAYIKRFDYNKNSVYQDVIAGQNYYSVRLVKDYDGDNFYDSEEILGQNYPTVLLPSTQKGKYIWTAINIYITRKHYKTLVPNNGLGITFTKKYFIDEWNGKTWLRNELKEGDSVVIKNAPHRQRNVEYRVIDGELVNTTTRIFEQVFDKVNIKFEELGNLIAEETLRSTAKDNDHDAKLTEIEKFDNEAVTKFEQIDITLEDLKNSIDNVEKTLNDKIEEGNSNVENLKIRVEGLEKGLEKTNTELSETNKELSDFKDEVNGSFEKVNESISIETQERVAKDNEHDIAIDELKNKVAKSVDWIDTSSENNPERKSIILKNHDNILGTATEDFGGGTYNLAMVSKWNVADFGSNQLPMNLNSKGRPTVNDKEELTYVSELNSVKDELTNNIETLKNETENHFKNVEDTINDVNETLTKKIEDEISNIGTEFDEKITTVEGQLLVAEGTSYDDVNGILTLKHKDDTKNEDIQIQFKFGNFGKF